MDLRATLANREQVSQFRNRHRVGLLALLFTDIVGSTELKERLGDAEALSLMQRHDRIVRELLRQFEEAEEINKAGDSFFIVFAKPSDAVKFALLLQSRLRLLARQLPCPVLVRIGIHVGEVVIEDPGSSTGRKDMLGIHVDTCARVASLAQANQILLTRFAFDNARQALKGQASEGLGLLEWRVHGLYLLKGIHEPMEICEVGEEALAPFALPPLMEKAQRYKPASQSEPVRASPAAPGAPPPQRQPDDAWFLPGWKRRLTEDWVGGAVGASLAVLIGLILPIGQGLEHLSFDLPFFFKPTANLDDVVIIEMDELSHRELNQPYGQKWDRKLHARLLDRLRADRSKLVVFDVVFAEAGSEDANAKLAEAIQRHGKVVLAADLAPIAHSGVVGSETLKPQFAEAAAGWGIARVLVDEDSTVRRNYPGTELDPSLSWAAAQLAGAVTVQNPSERLTPRWLNYYGPYGTLPRVSYYTALNQPDGFFSNKFVFVGGKPQTRFIGEETDEFRTPYTRWDGQFSSGAEIKATTFLNLLRGDCLTRLAPAKELALLFVAGLLAGYALTIARPMASSGLALLAFLGLGCAAVWLVQHQLVWFPWLVIGGAQIPCALVWSFLYHTRKLQKEKEALATVQPFSASLSGPPVNASQASVGHPNGPVTQTQVLPAAPHRAGLAPGPDIAMAAAAMAAQPRVPDHELLKPVGKGAYGEVWLARDAIQTYHAVKVVYRGKFQEETPYDREFRGVQKFTPISRQHAGLVHILHVGRNDYAGYFYYVMEAADDACGDQAINPDTYTPKTLATEIHRRKQFPFEECVELAIHLSAALDFLHQRGLIHRDIKPANILFVNGCAKLADIGLVTEMATQPGKVTFLGTEGYMAPEGPGTAAADVYSLGKVIYEAGMGRDRQEFPELPSFLSEREDRFELVELGRILLKACNANPRKRYKSAAQLQTELARLLRRFRPREAGG